MRKFSDIVIPVRSPARSLLFLLGLFSTMQILQFAGFAISTLLTVVIAGYFLLTRGLYYRRDNLLLIMLLSVIVTLGVSLLSQIPAAYKKSSITGTIQWLLIFLVCMYMRRQPTTVCTDAYFRGFTLSCKIQVAWCILQILLYYGLKLDLNTLLFSRFVIETSQYRDGVMACTGLHWHAANLIPVLAYLYFHYPNFLCKAICLVVVYFTKSATSILAVGFCVLLDLILFCKRTLCSREKSFPKKLAVYIIIGFFVLLLLSPLLLPKVWETVEYLALRFYQIANPSYGNESSAVHFNYYLHLPHILQNISLPELFAGSGIGTSGYRFTQFFGQYPDSIWVVESDPVNTILSQGLVGFLLLYSYLSYSIWRMLRKKQTGRACFLLVMLVTGLLYNNQLLWVQQLQFMLYCQLFQAPASQAQPTAQTDKE